MPAAVPGTQRTGYICHTGSQAQTWDRMPHHDPQHCRPVQPHTDTKNPTPLITPCTHPPKTPTYSCEMGWLEGDDVHTRAGIGHRSLYYNRELVMEGMGAKEPSFLNVGKLLVRTALRVTVRGPSLRDRPGQDPPSPLRSSVLHPPCCFCPLH